MVDTPEMQKKSASHQKKKTRSRFLTSLEENEDLGGGVVSPHHWLLTEAPLGGALETPQCTFYILYILHLSQFTWVLVPLTTVCCLKHLYQVYYTWYTMYTIHEFWSMWCAQCNQCKSDQIQLLECPVLLSSSVLCPCRKKIWMAISWIRKELSEICWCQNGWIVEGFSDFLALHICCWVFFLILISIWRFRISS